MIQRVQTIWLLLASAATLISLKTSFYSGTLISDNSFHSVMGIDSYGLMILTVALGTALFVNIFLFKHRMLQFRICIFALLAECLIIFLYFRQIKNYSNGNFSLWCALHVFILVFIIFAAIGIYKDEKLIKDSNRLR
ncbi:MAG TPA: DUF4293 family protein [Chitinophagaceae bacterium]|nr:DUF4293 family protein [Chitinophagaceae bacterium]